MLYEVFMKYFSLALPKVSDKVHLHLSKANSLRLLFFTTPHTVIHDNVHFLYTLFIPVISALIQYIRYPVGQILHTLI